MKRSAALLALLPALSWAAPFDGTWVAKVNTVKITGKPDTYLLADGMFTCGPCTPSYKVKADGSDQKLTGHAYYDTVSVKVIDPNTVQLTAHAAAKIFAERKFIVSADGKSMKEQLVSYQGPKPAKAEFNSTRVAAAPAGAHALSGSWQADPTKDTLPPDFTTVTYAETSNGLKMSSPNGQSYDAKFDGKEYLTEGDTGKTMVSLKRINANTVQETDSRGGKVTDVWTYTVSADGKTMRSVDKDQMHDTTLAFTSDKQ